MSDISGYEKLSNQIIITAVKDYRQALKKLRTGRKNLAAQQMKEECERFFTSQWFSVLSSVDGPTLMKKLQEEVEPK